jgi:hypothetical protein
MLSQKRLKVNYKVVPFLNYVTGREDVWGNHVKLQAFLTLDTEVKVTGRTYDETRPETRPLQDMINKKNKL